MYCINLQEFSVTFASADQYFVLGLSNWGGNELPSSILHIKNLKTFLFPLIECLVDLPENFADRIWLENPPNCEHDPSIILHKVLSSPAFISLRHLILCNIPMLSEIPDNISLLTSLESLTLTDMAKITSLPKTIKYLPRLIELIVYDCEMLQSILAVSLLLFHFTVSNCQSIETVLSSMGEPYYKPNPTVTLLDKPNPSTVTLINCKKLDSRSYQTVLKNWIELGARRNSSNEEDDTIQYLFPAMQGIEYWSHYSSTQVSFTLELPPNLFGFAYYLVLSQGHVGKCVSFGCECYLDNISGERICITSFQRDDVFKFRWYENIIHMLSDHVILWFDRVSCKKIMEEIKAINDVNNTGHSPKLTFRFFFDETLHDEVKIQKCGFHWIYQEEAASSTVFESHDDEDIETIPPTMKLKQRVFGNTMSSLELDQTKGLRYLLE
ncbi:disease resistance protein RUN1 [Trifolium repens]|nr:disease resistance protein RUN1 [Trifolium repens]